MGHADTSMGVLAVVAAAIAALLLLHHLVVQPKLQATTRIKLLLGLAVFPFIAAVATTASGMQRTTEREFCGSCHVMDTHLSDLLDPKSASLASRHSRNAEMGPHACYTCHADYGMLGYPMTKITGMSHVYNYYFGGYRKWSLEQFHAEVRIAKPFPNSNCRQCHSGTLASFLNVRDHMGVLDELEANTVSCASAGCHGVAHPFSKRPEELSR
jgi:nitrate/TMAO reductase-like tetraheme cytochrome c subunit